MDIDQRKPLLRYLPLSLPVLHYPPHPCHRWKELNILIDQYPAASRVLASTGASAQRPASLQVPLAAPSEESSAASLSSCPSSTTIHIPVIYAHVLPIVRSFVATAAVAALSETFQMSGKVLVVLSAGSARWHSVLKKTHPSRCMQPLSRIYNTRIAHGGPLVSGAGVNTCGQCTRLAQHARPKALPPPCPRSSDARALGRMPCRGERLHHRSRRKQSSTSRIASSPRRSASALACPSPWPRMCPGSASGRVGGEGLKPPQVVPDPRSPVRPVYHSAGRVAAPRCLLPPQRLPLCLKQLHSVRKQRCA